MEGWGRLNQAWPAGNIDLRKDGLFTLTRTHMVQIVLNAVHPRAVQRWSRASCPGLRLPPPPPSVSLPVPFPFPASPHPPRPSYSYAKHSEPASASNQVGNLRYMAVYVMRLSVTRQGIALHPVVLTQWWSERAKDEYANGVRQFQYYSVNVFITL